MNRNLRLLWYGVSASIFGSSIYSLALRLLALDRVTACCVRACFVHVHGSVILSRHTGRRDRGSGQSQAVDAHL